MIDNFKPSLLILYDYFYPGYRAGGPIQSLTNLVLSLGNYYDISFITSAFDLHSPKSYDTIKFDCWKATTLPHSDLPLNIWYSQKKLKIQKLKEILQQLKPAIIYFNGIFSYSFFVQPLVAIKKLNYKPKVVICPRGMLQQGAFADKYFKKKLYITGLQATGLLKKVCWHATNEQEKQDIKKMFGQDQKVAVASNIPKQPLLLINLPSKQNGKLRLVYLSLIAEKKNLLFTLEMINQCSGVTLDIYGPVKDESYWSECEKLIKQMAGKVEYKGEVVPAKVQETFGRYDASVLLTRGENFGHALYESLSVGRPVITSHFTPWINLELQKAGWNIGIDSVREGVALFNKLSNLPSESLQEYCVGAHQVALNYFVNLNSVEEYRHLFATS